MGLGFRAAPNPRNSHPATKSQRLQHHFLGSQLASSSCHPHPGLLPTAEASLPAGAGGQCHNSLSILPGPVRAMRQPGPSEQDLGVQAAYCTGELLPSFSDIEYGLVALEPLPIMSPFPPHSPEFPRMETGKSKFQ